MWIKEDRRDEASQRNPKRPGEQDRVVQLEHVALARDFGKFADETRQPATDNSPESEQQQVVEGLRRTPHVFR